MAAPLANNQEEAAQQSEQSRDIEAGKVIVISFRSLQLKRIEELQETLLGLSVSAASNANLLDKSLVDSVLKNYAEALQTYETLSQNAIASVPPGARLIGNLGGLNENVAEPTRSYMRDTILKVAKYFGAIEAFESWLSTIGPLVSFSGILPTSSLFLAALGYSFENEAMRRFSPSERLKFIELTTGGLGFRELDQQGRIIRAQKKAFTERVIMAMFGGISLIGPMLIMVLHPSQNTSIITVSTATFIFALILAVFARDSDGKDVLGATAAYAAVLVVFVGTSSGSS